MPRDPEQLLAAAREWHDVTEQTRTINELVDELAELATTANVRALERLLGEGPHGAVDELGGALVAVMERLVKFGPPIAELVSIAGARIVSLRVELAELVGDGEVDQ